MSDITKLECGVWVTKESILRGPQLQKNHIDGPLMTWGGRMHWLTLWERILLFINFITLDEIGEKRMPELKYKRLELWNPPQAQEE